MVPVLSNSSTSDIQMLGNVTDGRGNAIEIIGNLATELSYLTRPIQNKSILPLDLGNTNNILSSFLMLVNSS